MGAMRPMGHKGCEARGHMMIASLAAPNRLLAHFRTESEDYSAGRNALRIQRLRNDSGLVT
jgi:hypothetical protein